MKAEKENIIIELLRQKFPEVYAIYLYGSHATGLERPESDIDIAFLSNKKINPVERWNIQEFLAAKLDADVDLVDLTEASTVLCKEVIEKGKLLFTNNKYKTDSFEMTTCTMYMDLNESRIHILNDFKEKYGRDFN